MQLASDIAARPVVDREPRQPEVGVVHFDLPPPPERQVDAREQVAERPPAGPVPRRWCRARPCLLEPPDRRSYVVREVTGRSTGSGLDVRSASIDASPRTDRGSHPARPPPESARSCPRCGRRGSARGRPSIREAATAGGYRHRRASSMSARSRWSAAAHPAISSSRLVTDRPHRRTYLQRRACPALRSVTWWHAARHGRTRTDGRQHGAPAARGRATTCVVYDVIAAPSPRSTPRRRRDGAAALDDFVAALAPATRHLADGAGRVRRRHRRAAGAAPVARRHDHRRRQLVVPPRRRPVGAARRAGHPLPRRRHERRRPRPGARLLPDDRRRRRRRRPARPDLRHPRPGRRQRPSARPAAAATRRRRSGAGCTAARAAPDTS